MDGRIRLLRFVFIAFLVLVGGKAVALASTSGDLTRIAHEQQTAVVVLPARRGSILDRNGRELAVGKPAKTVFATPYLLDDRKAAARSLCGALKITGKRNRRALERALAVPGSGFAYVARVIDPGLAAAALALDLPGVGAYDEEERSYPMKGSAAQVLGFAGVEGKGLAGVEMQYDKQLAGMAGSEVIVRDPAGHTLRTVRETQPSSGQSVRLTLDEDIQYTAEDVLQRTVRSSSATAATAIVMDPRTGEILAMANVPKVKDNAFGRTPAFDRNRCITDIYEPGSIFKLVTISGALADGLVKPTTKFTLQPSLTLYDRTINESHERGTVTYSVREILQWSSNVGAVTIGMEMGKKRLLKWMNAFGFAKTTGVGFPGEAAGIVPPADQWSGTSIVNIPMGQGIAVTPMQMAAAFSTVANNGVAVTPRLIAQVGDAVSDGAARHRVIPASVARAVRSMLTTAVDEGTGYKARIPGYRVAGKTGTAEKALPDGSGYSKTDYVASFIGMVPADHPRLVVLVAVDSPHSSSIYGGDIAAPAVQKIMRFALQQLEIAP
ncbi:MAG: penicillin-binding protein 2 [Actinobacteria bacterium]|nr:penicillin-binding protein 2 [Actinomycetota bacterium]